MSIYELAVCVKDEDDLASGYKTKKKGDVMVARSRQRKSTTDIDHYEIQDINGKMKNVPIMIDIDEDFHWGNMEINSHLIVIADINDIQSNLDKKFICKSNNDDERAYKIDLNDLKINYCPELDLVKVEDKNKIYQPFKKASLLLEKFNCQNAINEIQRVILCKKNKVSIRRKEIVISLSEYDNLGENFKSLINYHEIDLTIIDEKDVDCGLSAENEIIIPKDVNDLIYSKDKSQYVVIKNELVKEVV